MKLDVLIFEDDKFNLREIVFLLAKNAPDWNIVGSAANIRECRHLLATCKADVIFSDIHFGKDVIFEKLPELADFNGKMVFISGDNNYAAQSFEMNAVNYLLKPIDEHAFRKMIIKVMGLPQREEYNPVNVFMKNLNEPDSSKKRISFYTKDGFVINKISDILFLKADNNYTEVNLVASEKILVTKTILHFEKMLEPFGFVRVHQSFIVNIEHVKLFNRDENYITMKNHQQVPVSQRKKTVLMNLLNNNIF